MDPEPSSTLGAPLGLRARALLGLEAWFRPLIDAPLKRGEHARYEFDKAEGSYGRFVEELGGLDGRAVLDFGCGWGGESAWLARRAATVVGCDTDPEALKDARRFKAVSGTRNLEFARCGQRDLPFANDCFDCVFSANVFEHVMFSVEMMREICRVLKPGGSFVSTFGPLFHSPLGYHLSWATQVPYAHLLFGFKAVLAVRDTKRSPIQPPPRDWRETGLNQMTFGQFRRAVRQSGLVLRRLRRIPVRGQRIPAALPVVGMFLTFGVDCHLVKSGPAPAGSLAGSTSAAA